MIGPTNAMTVTGTVDPSGVTVGSDTKPVKIVNGVATMVANDLVSTTGNQTIPGRKTFTTTPIMEGDSSLMEALILKNKAIASNTENATTGKNTLLNYLANDNTILARLRYRTGSGMLRNFNVDLYDNTGLAKTLVLAQIVGNGDITSPMVSDALDSYAPMVRTTGNQTVAGIKTNTNIHDGITRKSIFMRVASSQEQNQNLHWFKILDIQQNFKLKMEAYSRYGYWHVVVAGSNTLQTNAIISKVGQWANLSNKLKACLNSTTGRWEIWLDSPSGNTGGGLTINVEADPMAGSTTDANWAVLNYNATATTEPTVGTTYTIVDTII